MTLWPNKEELAQLYSQYSLSEMAKILGTSPSGIHYKLKALGIPLRKRGGAQNYSKYFYKLHLVDQRVIQEAPIRQLQLTYGVYYKSVQSYRRTKK